MPELPEVETVCRALTCHLPGKKIVDVEVRQVQLRHKVDPVKLNKICQNRSITSLHRRAKYIIVELDSPNGLLLHLGMTGKFRLVEKSTPFRKHEHISLNFTDNSSLRYEDHRRFGSFIAIKLPKNREDPSELKNLGPEPLTDFFNGNYLYKIAKSKQKPIKNLIMDNATVVGVGNIYAAEALFRAKIHPARNSNSITKKEIDKLVSEIKNILLQAINAGGTTFSDFISPDGQKGYFFNELAVYGKESQPCQICQHPVSRLVQAGRSTFFCGNCQI